MKLLAAILALLSYSENQIDDLAGNPHAKPAKGSIGDTYTVSSSLAAEASATPKPLANTPAPFGSTSTEPYPAVGKCTGDCGSVHDPSVVVRDDGKHYRFSTFDRISIATADSISGPWKHQGSALKRKSIINKPGRDVLWAPDVFHIDDTYYMYYAVSVVGSNNSDIGVATSKTMDAGTWQDHGSIGIPADVNWNRIDPNLFWRGPGTPMLLTFGSYWGGIQQIQMEKPPIKVAKSSANNVVNLVYNGTDNKPDNIPVNAVEGGYQFWWNVNGTAYNYLFWSAGVCCNAPPNLVPAGEEYKIMVCRSEAANGGFTGPALRACTEGGGVEVLGSHGKNFYAPGGQGVMFDNKLKSPVLYYHYVDPTKGYKVGDFQFGWNKLDFSSGWPVVVV